MTLSFRTIERPNRRTAERSLLLNHRTTELSNSRTLFPVSAEARLANPVSLAAFFFWYYAAVGFSEPYLPPFWQTLGFSPAQLGALNAILPGISVLTPFLWTAYADLARAGTGILRFNIWVCAAAALLLPLLDAPALVATALVVYATFRTPLVPLANSMVLAAVGGRPQAFAAVRMWGTVGYIATAWGGGILADRLGLRPVILGVGLSLLVSGAIAWAAVRQQRMDLPPARLADILAVLRDRRLLTLLAATALAWMSYGPYTTFFTIQLGALGYSRTFAGAAWAVAASSELAVMACWARLWPLLSARRWLGLAIAACALRWLLLIPAREPVSLLLVQLTNALTFGVFYLSAVELVDALVPRTLRATAQGVFSSVTFGVGSFIGNLLGGLLYPVLGMTWLYAASAGVAAAGLVVHWLGGRIGAPAPPAAGEAP